MSARQHAEHVLAHKSFMIGNRAKDIKTRTAVKLPRRGSFSASVGLPPGSPGSYTDSYGNDDGDYYDMEGPPSPTAAAVGPSRPPALSTDSTSSLPTIYLLNSHHRDSGGGTHHDASAPDSGAASTTSHSDRSWEESLEAQLTAAAGLDMHMSPTPLSPSMGASVHRLTASQQQSPSRPGHALSSPRSPSGRSMPGPAHYSQPSMTRPRPRSPSPTGMKGSPVTGAKPMSRQPPVPPLAPPGSPSLDPLLGEPEETLRRAGGADAVVERVRPGGSIAAFTNDTGGTGMIWSQPGTCHVCGEFRLCLAVDPARTAAGPGRSCLSCVLKIMGVAAQ